jgi:hypothetical protein
MHILPRLKRLFGLGGLGGFLLLVFSNLAWLSSLAQSVQFALTVNGEGRLATIWNSFFVAHGNVWLTILGFCMLIWVIVRPERKGQMDSSTQDTNSPPKFTYSRPEGKPNLEMIKPQVREVKLIDKWMRALLVPFRNDVIHQDDLAKETVAHITYRGSGSTIRVNYGLWENEASNRVTFDRSDTKYLIVAVTNTEGCIAIENTDAMQNEDTFGYFVLGYGQWAIEIELVAERFKRVYPSLTLYYTEDESFYCKPTAPPPPGSLLA